MSRILAVDTTSDHGSIALVEDDRLIEEVALQSPEGFGHVLFTEIEKLLTRHGVTPDSIDIFASASGPGSFTGVRVGLTAVKALAEATGRKAVAVSNLRALAFFGTHPLRATVIDARRGEVYGAVYNGALELVCGEVVAPYPQWIASLPAGELEFITTGYEIDAPRVVKAPLALAGAIGKIAARCEPQVPEAIDANYVRRSDAELLWKDVI